MGIPFRSISSESIEIQDLIDNTKKNIDGSMFGFSDSVIKKVRITEKKSEFLYRSAQIDFMNESKTVHEEELKRKKLINKFISLISSPSEKINLKFIDTSMISTEMLTNLAALILPLDEFDKQKLLELSDVGLRLDVLCQFMDSELKIESDMLNFKQIIPRNINWN